MKNPQNSQKLHSSQVLAADDGLLAREITPETLNAIISEGQLKGKSVAFRLVCNVSGRALLAADDGLLARRITPKTLNAIVPEGEFKGESVALWLSCNAVGRALLAADDGQLAREITPKTLNAIIPAGQFKGKSVAYFLAGHTMGRALLAADDGLLAREITPETLNAIIPEGQFKGKSVALYLATNSSSWELLEVDDCRLGLAISLEIFEQVLDHLLSDHSGDPSAFKKHRFFRQYKMIRDSDDIGMLCNAAALQYAANSNQFRQWRDFFKDLEALQGNKFEYCLDSLRSAQRNGGVRIKVPKEMSSKAYEISSQQGLGRYEISSNGLSIFCYNPGQEGANGDGRPAYLEFLKNAIAAANSESEEILVSHTF